MLKLKLLSLKVSLGSYETLLCHIVNLAKQHKPSYVCIANVHSVVEARRNRSFREALTSADIVAPDGMPLSRSIKLLHGIKQEPQVATELLNGLFARAEEEQLPVFFYGGSSEVLKRASDYITQHYPSLQIAGKYSYPFRSLTEQDKEDIANKITKSKAQIVFVVSGVRRQEKWMYEMRGRIPGVMVGIGDALPALVGIKKRAPKWMKNGNMEWAYNMANEPRKIFTSYLATYAVYTTLVLSEKIRLLMMKSTSTKFTQREIIEPLVQ
ncbi:WecB/TagA/CpsF family glycosyltransferase [Deminuibacter soli]|uniref:Glycosyltransferase n=1 Tax=Deminuibacter soli TaxID=2291815 RepID=A0A3E1NHI6_9BACT|nr:WecB/TagA/CpsF family glycosyltransferase [Deminuibacter soli]RFM27409.1 glycosyltransferase [Deminuibacter soli]